jgi:hypothetical protein
MNDGWFTMTLLARRLMELDLTRLFVVCWAVLAGGLVGTVASEPTMVRWTLFFTAIFLVISFGWKRPQIVIIGLITYLVLLGFLRRVLIPITGWPPFDPLVIIGPASISFITLFTVFSTRSRVAQEVSKTRLSRLVKAMIVVDMLEVVNPAQGSIMTGVAGILFYVIPLLWFIVGRRYLTDVWANRLTICIFTFGIIVALYGLKQTFFGDFPFEKEWITLGGYSALHVGDVVRAFSTFTSSSEYSQYLGIALVIAFSLFLQSRGLSRVVYLLGLVTIEYALFMESTRGVLLTSAVAVATLAILNVKPKYRFTMGVVTVLLLVVGYNILTHLSSSGNALVQHQVEGLAHPFDSRYSTLGIHASEFINGLVDGFVHPVGNGLGSTTIAVSKFSGVGTGTEVTGTEVDISNMFSSDGFVGGIIYLIMVFYTLILAVRESSKQGSLNLRIVLGVLISTIGQWSNGGDYSTCAIVWLLIGYLDRQVAHYTSFSLTQDGNLSRLSVVEKV